MLTDLDNLTSKLALPITQELLAVNQDFPLLVSKDFADRVVPASLNDPLLLQFLPQAVELMTTEGFSQDPLAESVHTPIPGLIHKYADRVLLLVSHQCAIHCRFCFRRHQPIMTQPLTTTVAAGTQLSTNSLPEPQATPLLNWPAILGYIQQHPAIIEIILSGGDPLMLNMSELTVIIQQLAELPQLKRLRIHTRVPIVLPTKQFYLPVTRLTVIIVVHCNHPQELNDKVIKNIQQLRQQGITILNQSVLLKGINDNLTTLINLSEALFAIGILPYYIHLLDKVQGAAHFYVTPKQAKQLQLAMQKQLAGYLVPKFMQDKYNGKHTL